MNAEQIRLQQDAARERNWKRWGPYLSERQWGTVREDYSVDANCWDDLPHDHARSRAYRWGEDGLLGICDRQCRLCFALALWNGRDGILKERLFGLTNREGNHGEDVKEQYYYLDSTPTHSYMKALYKYPQQAFPYEQLVRENARRDRGQPEYELLDTGVFGEDRYFDVTAAYAKADAEDIHIRITVTNHGPEAAPLHVLPTLWFRNTWIWGCKHEGCGLKPRLAAAGPQRVVTRHESLTEMAWEIGPGPDGALPQLLFTENETNVKRFHGTESYTPYVKDAFHRRVVHDDATAVNPAAVGTKVAAWYRLQLAPGETQTIELRLHHADAQPSESAAVFAARRSEADIFYADLLPVHLSPDQTRLARQAYAGLLWTKQFYHYVVQDWLEGDRLLGGRAAERRTRRNVEWRHVYIRCVMSMPDKWEYPWFAAWDLAFHMIPFARLDAEFAKDQLLRLLREWFMHPNGQIPAYEFAFSDVNPPVHAWACWRVYKMTGRDRRFLASAFQKLLLNFTWWVNRKDPDGSNLFSGGFLGLDNIGVFDRSRPLPTGGSLQQADGTAWMAFYCGTMLSMALELAQTDPEYEDMASKFFEHFIQITDAMNELGGSGLWNEDDGFYYDQLNLDSGAVPLRVRSIVGMIALFAVEVTDGTVMQRLPGFRRRAAWFLKYRPDLAKHISFLESAHGDQNDRYLLAIPTRERLERVLGYLLDEREFLSPYGIRSLSRIHAEAPYSFHVGSDTYTVGYEPGESSSPMFGGNSNWRGPIWFPINFLLLEALERYHHYYGDELQVECPSGSGHRMNLQQVACEISKRLIAIFAVDDNGHRPYQSAHEILRGPHFQDLFEFHEFFHGDSGVGCGASHQTGWTALVVSCLDKVIRDEGSC